LQVWNNKKKCNQSPNAVAITNVTHECN